MSVDLSVTELAIAGKQRKTQEKKHFVKDQIYYENFTTGNSRQTQEKPKLAFARQKSGVQVQSHNKNTQ